LQTAHARTFTARRATHTHTLRYNWRNHRYGIVIISAAIVLQLIDLQLWHVPGTL